MKSRDAAALACGLLFAISLAAFLVMIVKLVAGNRWWVRPSKTNGRFRLSREAPPTPFHVQTKLGEPGDPRTGISTRDTDNFYAAVRRAFGSHKKSNKPLCISSATLEAEIG